ncbi:MAG: hypothetical protein ACRDJW_05820 [Thermomicrobiales bacterium]
MKLAMPRRPATTNEYTVSGPTLTVVGRPAAILPWPGEPAPRPEPAVAELRTRLFREQSVEQDQYSVTVNAAGRSVNAVLAALADACDGVEEFGRALGGDDQLILSIQVRL